MSDIVFDFGGVLFEWQPHTFMTRLLPQHAPDPAAARAVVQAFFQGFGGDWGEFDRGTIERGPLADAIARRTGLTRAEVDRVIDAVPHELKPIAGTVALLERLHRGREVAGGVCRHQWVSNPSGANPSARGAQAMALGLGRHGKAIPVVRLGL